MSVLGFGELMDRAAELAAIPLHPVASYMPFASEQDGFCFLHADRAPFVLGGIDPPEQNGGEYYRLDASKKAAYSAANASLADCTAGGTIRFTTDADEIFVRIRLRSAVSGMHHFCDRGVYGIDVYAGTGSKRKYLGEMMQHFAESPRENEGRLSLPAGVNEVMIELPLYSGITSIEIGFPKESQIGKPTERDILPVAFYGSSITQGGCVSRPGNAYSNIICRALNADCRNFGFSGSALGETAVAEYIANCALSCFVMDYDYNSPSCEHLSATHELFFQTIRTRQPELPVVLVTHPFYDVPTENDLARIAVVRQTYENALRNGDQNVFFVDSRNFFTPEFRDLYAVDYLHPNDLGQMSMAQVIFPAVQTAVSKKR